MILSKQPSFDPKFDIIPIEFVRYYPKFINMPIVNKIDIHDINLSIKLDSDGWMFVVAIPYSISVNQARLSELTY